MAKVTVYSGNEAALRGFMSGVAFASCFTIEEYTKIIIDDVEQFKLVFHSFAVMPPMEYDLIDGRLAPKKVKESTCHSEKT